ELCHRTLIRNACANQPAMVLGILPGDSYQALNIRAKALRLRLSCANPLMQNERNGKVTEQRLPLVGRTMEFPPSLAMAHPLRPFLFDQIVQITLLILTEAP